MGSKARLPPPHIRHPLPGPSMIHPEPFGPGMRPPPGRFPPFDMLPPPEVMEQKLAGQHVEMQKLATENQRLAATLVTLRQELASAQHELQMLHAHIEAAKSEREQQRKGIGDKIVKMEAELHTAEPIKKELQRARADAESLVTARQELLSKGQQLTDDLRRAHSEAHLIPALMSELDGLRQEYHHCRATYDYEKKLYHDHLESLQVMEKNYMTMAREVEKLRAELTNASNVDRRTGGPYGGSAGYNENELTGHYRGGQNLYTEGYGGTQAHVLTGNGGASGTGGVGAASPQVGTQAGPVPPVAGYESLRGTNYDPQRGMGRPTYESYDAQAGLGYDGQKAHGYEMQRGGGGGFDIQKGAGYDVQGGSGYDLHRGPAYDGPRAPAFDSQRGPGYDSVRAPGYDGQRGPNFDMSKNAGYDASSRGGFGPHGQIAGASNATYGSGTPPTNVARDFEAAGRGANPRQK